MKKGIAILLILIFVLPISAFSNTKEKRLDYSESYFKGQEDAEMFMDTSGMWVGGTISGFFLGIIGLGLNCIVAGTSNPHPQMLPDNVDHAAYHLGYKDEAKSKKLGAAIWSGLIGITAGTVVYIAVLSN